MGALCGVFVGHGSCFWESDRKWAKAFSPQYCPYCRETGAQLIDHCAQGGRTDAVGGMGEQNMYNMDKAYVGLFTLL